MANPGGIKVTIVGDYTDKEIKKAIRDLESLRKDAGSTSKEMGGLGKAFVGVGAAIAATFTISTLTNFLKDATQAAIEDEKSMVSLAKAMENMGLAAQNAGVEQFVEQLMLATGVADDQLRPAMSRLLLVTGDVAESQRGLQLAMDIAAGTGRDLDSVTTALAKAYGGQTTALGRLGVGLDQATLKSKDMDLITGALSQKFEGQAAAAADTYGGRIQRLNVAVGEAQETIGYALLKALDDVTAQFGGSDGFTETVADAGKKAATLVAGVGALATGLANLAARLQTLGGIKLPAPLERIFDVLTAPLPLNQLKIIVDGLFRIGTESENTARKQQILQDAMEGVTNGVPRFIAAMGGAEAGVRRFGQSAAAAGFDVAAFYGVNPSAQRALAEARANVDSIVQKYNEAERATSGLGSATKNTTEELTKLQEQFGKPLAERANTFLGELKNKAKEARDEMLSFYESIKQNVSNTFSLSNALTSASNAASNYASTQKALADATKNLAEAQNAESEARKRHDEVMAESDASASQRQSVQKALANAVSETAEATRNLTLAQQEDSKAADEHGKTYIQRLQEQAGAAQQFLQTIITLYSMGLRGEALAQIGQMSAQAGITAGTELINGGEAAITETMRLVDATNGAATKIAELTTAGFIGTGVITANNTVKGFEDVMGEKGTGKKKLMQVMDRLAADLQRETTITVTTVHRSVYESVGLPGRAMGGPVTAEQAYVVGERGPEVFVPDVSGTIVPNHALPSPATGGLGGGITLNVYAGMGTDGGDVGRQIVDALRQYERRNGPVPITVR